jgi:TPR repeat protein
MHQIGGALGNTDAKVAAGGGFLNGVGGGDGRGEAFEWFESAAEDGHQVGV